MTIFLILQKVRAADAAGKFLEQRRAADKNM
jgi:hypothetical protein